MPYFSIKWPTSVHIATLADIISDNFVLLTSQISSCLVYLRNEFHFSDVRISKYNVHWAACKGNEPKMVHVNFASDQCSLHFDKHQKKLRSLLIIHLSPCPTQPPIPIPTNPPPTLTKTLLDIDLPTQVPGTVSAFSYLSRKHGQIIKTSKFLTQSDFIAELFHLVAAVTHVPVHRHSADYIFFFFGIIEFIRSHFENRVLLN